jgi:multidrug resistance efflux pump
MGATASSEPVAPTRQDTEGEAAAEPEAEPAPSAEEAGTPAAPPADVEQANEAPAVDDPWAAKELAVPWTRRWYARLGKTLVVVGATVGALAVWPHRLYITEPCVLTPRHRVMVRAPFEGLLREILVDEGALVKKGQLLAQLDDRTLQAERRRAAVELERLRANLKLLQHGARAEEIERLRASVRGGQQELAFARREVARYEGLVKIAAASVEKLDAASRDAAVKEKTLAESEAALRLLLAGTRPEQIDAAKAEVARAEGELAFVDERLRMVRVEAPIDGRVLTPRLRERLLERIPAGGVICEVADLDMVSAEISVPEREIDGVHVGQATTVKVEGYPGEAFTGAVEHIGEVVDRKDEGGSVRVVTAVKNRDGMLKQDMTGWAEIDAGERTLLDLATRRFLRFIHVRFLF